MSKNYLSIVDAQVAGEPLRLVTGGPKLKGDTIIEKRDYFKKHYDHIRKAVMREPRGHADMYGAVLTDPTDTKADLGIIFIDTLLYNNMCGHGSMAIASIAVEVGLVTVVEPVTTVVLETGAGLVKVLVEVADGKAVSATLEGVPSFSYKSDVPINVFGEEITVDIIYGGNFFAMVDIDQLGFDYSIDYSNEFIKYGQEIRNQVNENIELHHPEKEHITKVDDILFVGSPKFEGDTYKSLCFLGEAQLDRSPCGTGTSARMAALYEKGLLSIGETFYHESIIGTVFEGVVDREVMIGDIKGIIPFVKSRAFVTGMGNLIIDSDDPLSEGFILR